MKFKYHTLVKIILVVGGCAALQLAVQAQGTAFTYQGQLNTSGTPANGNFDITFSLFTTNTDGTAIAGPVTNSAVLVSNGLFSTLVDFGNAFSGGGSNWLEIAVSTNGANDFSTLSPRQQLSPVPYAITAAHVTSGGLADGTYGGALNLTNSLNQITGTFAGDGSELNSVDAYSLNGLTSASFWQLGGNAGANPTNGAFLGTTDNLPLEFKVNGTRGLRLEYAQDSQYYLGNTPNVIGGSSKNVVSNEYVGGFIGGGGNATYPNRVSGSYASVLGGFGNAALGNLSTAIGSLCTASAPNSTAIGEGNTASANYATALGAGTTASGWVAMAMGVDTVASGYYSTAMGNATTARGYSSTAMGENAIAFYDHSFVWSDGANWSSTAANQFMVHATGGLHLDGGGLAVTGATSPNYAGAKGVFIEGQGSYGAIFAFDYSAGHTLPLCLNSPGGNVGIGTTSPDATLTVYGTADKPGGGSWNTYSDARLKDVGARFTAGLTALEKIQPIHYHYKTDNALKLPATSEYIGVVAQQLQQAVPEAVQTNGSGYLTVNNDPVLWTTVNAVKELQAENTELKVRLEKLEKLLARAVRE